MNLDLLKSKINSLKGSLIKETPSNKVMKTRSNHVVKGMIFAGCSFTWGQGLYYYSNLPTLKEPAPFLYDGDLVEQSHIKFMESVRFPRLVANHFKTFEMVHPVNGGSHQVAISWWEKSFAGKKEAGTSKLDYSDISCLVFQCTQWHRNFFEFEYQGEKFNIACHKVYEKPYSEIFSKWLIEQNLSLTEWENFHIKNNIDMIKPFLQEVEQHGIKTVVLTWPEENVEYIKNDPWLYERFMRIDYKDKTYDSMYQLMWDEGNNELVISTDNETFEVTPKDHHPSLKCHQVMAENIIKHLENII